MGILKTIGNVLVNGIICLLVLFVSCVVLFFAMFIFIKILEYNTILGLLTSMFVAVIYFGVIIEFIFKY